MLGRAVGLGLAGPLGGECAVGLAVAEGSAIGLLDAAGEFEPVGDDVALGAGDASSLAAVASAVLIAASRDWRVGDEVASGSGLVGDESMEVADVDGDALTRVDALADGDADAVVDEDDDADDDGSTAGSVFVRSSGLHRSGMPSAASSESVDASAGDVPTSDAMIAMQDAAMTIRRTRVTRALALAITRKINPRHS